MSYKLNVRCKFCDRFIPIEANGTSNIRVRCNDRKCKQWNDVKIVMMSDHLNHVHTDKCNHQDQSALIQEKDLAIMQKEQELTQTQSKIAEMEQYISSLEGIVDGQ